MNAIKLVLPLALASMMAFGIALDTPSAAIPVEATSSKETETSFCDPLNSCTCHELCRIGCVYQHYGDPAMQNLCTWNCIDQQCGGGPFPVH
jgi:hypothetical protein